MNYRQFSLRTVLLVLTGVSVCLALWRTGRIPVLVGTLLATLGGCGVALVFSRFAYRRWLPFLGAMIGVLVAHLEPIYEYYTMAHLDIRDWSVASYLFFAACATISGACVGATRSANPVGATLVGAAVSGLLAVGYVLIVFLAWRYRDLTWDPGRWLSTMQGFLYALGRSALLVGAITGCLTGLVALLTRPPRTVEPGGNLPTAATRKVACGDQPAADE